MVSTIPWIEKSEGGPSPFTFQKTKPLSARTCFAMQVLLRSFKQLERGKWGWNASALYEEYLQRLRLFLASLHPRDFMLESQFAVEQTLAFRYWFDPIRQSLIIVIIGVVRAENLRQAEHSAHNFWQGLLSTFPYDFILRPAATQEEFVEVTGARLLEPVCNPDQILLLRRFECLLSTGEQALYVLGKWQANNHSEEILFRALCQCDVPVMINLSFKPVVFFDQDRYLLVETEKALRQVSNDQEALMFLRKEAEQAANLHLERLRSWRYPYLLQVLVASPQEIPSFLLQAVGAAISNASKDSDLAPGYQVIRPNNPIEVKRLKAKLIWPDVDVEIGHTPDKRFLWLRDFTGLDEVCAVIRPLFPPPDGIPGISISKPEI